MVGWMSTLQFTVFDKKSSSFLTDRDNESVIAET